MVHVGEASGSSAIVLVFSWVVFLWFPFDVWFWFSLVKRGFFFIFLEWLRKILILLGRKFPSLFYRKMKIYYFFTYFWWRVVFLLLFFILPKPRKIWILKIIILNGDKHLVIAPIFKLFVFPLHFKTNITLFFLFRCILFLFFFISYIL